MCLRTGRVEWRMMRMPAKSVSNKDFALDVVLEEHRDGFVVKREGNVETRRGYRIGLDARGRYGDEGG